ncbi:MAG TPA: hypothetical protein VJV23_16645 [Candidatus Polarisedimenticolia bacterium]|nr:hypothetical protein [Candidatus Polarisedimenticolia bacterium]
MFEVVARVMAEGGVPYRDVWDIKPPGIFFVYALARALFGEGVFAVRLLEAAGFASLVAAFVLLSRRRLGSSLPGLFGGTLAVWGHVQLDFWHTAQAESFGAVLIAWAVLAADAAVERPLGPRAWLRCAAAGCLHGCAFVLKPFLGSGVLIGAALAVMARRRSGGAGIRTLGPAAAMIAGFAAPAAATALWFAWHGALSDLVETLFVFVPRYAAVDAGRASPLFFVLFAFQQGLVLFGNLTLPGILLLLAFAPAAPREREAVVHVGGVLVLLLLGVAAQGKFFAYHQGAALSLASLLAGWGLWKLWRIASHRRAAAAAFGMASLALLLLPTLGQLSAKDEPLIRRAALRLAALLRPASRVEIEDRLHSRNDMDAAQNRLAAEWLRQQTPPGSRVHVWGFEPVLYLMSDRMPASRYIQNQPQRVEWGRAEARARLMEDLRRTPPAAMVVVHGDVMPRVVGNDRDSASELEDFDELRALLESGYRLDLRTSRFSLYARSARP